MNQSIPSEKNTSRVVMHLPQCMCVLAACKRTAFLFTVFRHNGLEVRPSCYYDVSISVHLVMFDKINIQLLLCNLPLKREIKKDKTIKMRQNKNQTFHLKRKKKISGT